MPRHITVIILIIFALFVLVGLTRQISQALQAGTRLELEVEQVNSLQKENVKLKEQLSYVGSQDYLEQIAHDKLNLSQKGEVVVIVPPEVLEKALAVPKNVSSPQIPNWQGWLS